MRYPALLFDCFRTILLFTPQAPTGQVKEPTWRAAMGALRGRAAPLLGGIEFDFFLDALYDVSVAIAKARPPEHREVPIEERYRARPGPPRLRGARRRPRPPPSSPTCSSRRRPPTPSCRPSTAPCCASWPARAGWRWSRTSTTARPRTRSSPITASPTAAMICANLDRLELFVGGEHFATVLPDTDGYPHLGYPPSFADFRAVDGSSLAQLRIDGYLGTGKVASRSFSADPSGDVLALAADDAEIAGDGADATRLEFRAVDHYGAPRPYVPGQVGFDVEGPAVLVGDNPFDFAAAGGALGPSGYAPCLARGAPSPSGPATPALGDAFARIRVR